MSLRAAVNQRAAELSVVEIAAAYAATAGLTGLTVAAVVQLAQLNPGALLPLLVVAAPIAAAMVGALLLCHALAVAKLEQLRPT